MIVVMRHRNGGGRGKEIRTDSRPSIKKENFLKKAISLTFYENFILKTLGLKIRQNEALF